MDKQYKSIIHKLIIKKMTKDCGVVFSNIMPTMNMAVYKVSGEIETE